MIIADWHKYQLNFLKPARTSRGALEHHTIWYLILRDSDQPAVVGIGECAPLPGLSIDYQENLEPLLIAFCKKINQGLSFQEAIEGQIFPALTFAWETALLDLKNGGWKQLFDTPFTQGQQAIPINGLVWMDTCEAMLQQAETKIAQGFSCIKFKIGALDFDEECRMLEQLRKKYTAWKVEVRVDANGAFDADTAQEQLRDLSRFELHSIEQPIKPKQRDALAKLCSESPIPIALDEELIGIATEDEITTVLEQIKPQYLILKPTLIGGLAQADQWIRLARKHEIGWWATSALESNVGLNAIAQWVSSYSITLPQGLGTGQLYHNNPDSPLHVAKGFISYQHDGQWDQRFWQ